MSVEDATDIGEMPEDSLGTSDSYQAPQEARLYVRRFEPWSVMKTAFILSLGLAIITIVATILLWGILAALGVFRSVNSAVESLAGSSSSVLDIEHLFGIGNVLGGSIVLAILNVVLFTVLATLFAFMYNLTVPLGRGIEVTLSEE